MADTPDSGGSSLFSFVNILFVVVGLLLIYYLYRFLQTSAYSSSTVLIPSQKAANIPPETLPVFPKPYEGGDYSVNTWLYLNSLNTNNKRKHVLEIEGVHFSTLLVAIGAFKNSLIVRTQYTDPTEGFQNPMSDYTSGIVNRVKSVMNSAKEGFQSGSGSLPGPGSAPGSAPGTGPGSAPGSPPGAGPGSAPGSTPRSGTGSGSMPTVPSGSGSIRTGTGTGSGSGSRTITTTTTTNSGDIPGTLSKSAIEAMFLPMASDDSLLSGAPHQCDIPEIDLQRWTMVTIVLSGKTVDVYIDGKLSRSCVTKSYFKVDPTEDVTINIADRGGFDGYIGNTTVGSYSMNPDEIYKTYLAGPSGVSLDLFSWIISIFKGAKLS